MCIARAWGPTRIPTMDQSLKGAAALDEKNAKPSGLPSHWAGVVNCHPFHPCALDGPGAKRDAHPGRVLEHLAGFAARGARSPAARVLRWCGCKW